MNNLSIESLREIAMERPRVEPTTCRLRFRRANHCARPLAGSARHCAIISVAVLCDIINSVTASHELSTRPIHNSSLAHNTTLTFRICAVLVIIERTQLIHLRYTQYT